jgi:hypothetical protein
MSLLSQTFLIEEDISCTIYDVIFFLPVSESTLIFWTPGKCLLVLLPEYFALPIFAVSIYAMNRGVEVDHPIYSVLLFNLVFPTFATLVIVSASFFVNVNNWKTISSVVNLISMLYHHSSWAVLSALRHAMVTFCLAIVQLEFGLLKCYRRYNREIVF